MKKALLFMMAAMIMVGTFSCKKDSEDPAPTPAPVAGFSAKVNGTSWTANTYAATFVNSSNLLQVTAMLSTTAETLSISLFASTTGTFQFGGGENEGLGTIGGNTFTTLPMNPAVGQVVITKFDKTAKLISGTFYFDGVDLYSTIYHVTEGKFENVPIVVNK